MTHKPLAILCGDFPDDSVSWLGQHCRVRSLRPESPGFPQALHEASALVVRTDTPVDEALLAQAPRLRVVGRAGVGLDHIDVEECRRRAIEVVYTPDANTQAVVEFVLCLLCDATRPRRRIEVPLDAAAWERLRTENVARHQMDELDLGILGMGRIGRRVAQVAVALGCRVRYNDLLPIPADGARSTTVESLFEESDVLSIHIDGRPSNRDFISFDLVDRMKPEVLFLNTSRGLVVDNVALARFLQAHPGARAHLDVHEPEPFDGTYPLLGLPNAVLYPHLASRTGTAIQNMSMVVRDVVAVLDGRTPDHPAPP